MLNIYECTPEVCIDGEWTPCTFFSRTRAFEDSVQTEIWYPTFADLVSACERKIIVNAEVVTTFWNKKPLCKISTAWSDFPIRITEKNFKPIGFRWRCEIKKNVTMRYLIDNLPVEDFAKWAAEKNISISFN